MCISVLACMSAGPLMCLPAASVVGGTCSATSNLSRAPSSTPFPSHRPQGNLGGRHNKFSNIPAYCRSQFFAYTKFSRVSRGHLQSRKYCARERSKFGKYFRQPVSALAPGHLHLRLHRARPITVLPVLATYFYLNAVTCAVLLYT